MQIPQFFTLELPPQAVKDVETCARKTLTPRFTDFFTDFGEKNRLFCSLTALFLFLSPQPPSPMTQRGLCGGESSWK